MLAALYAYVHTYNMMEKFKVEIYLLFAGISTCTRICNLTSQVLLIEYSYQQLFLFINLLFRSLWKAFLKINTAFKFASFRGPNATSREKKKVRKIDKGRKMLRFRNFKIKITSLVII